MQSDSTVLDKISTAVIESNDLDSLVRPLLEVIQDVTGLESIYLTRIDQYESLQQVLFSYNKQAKRFEIPEDLSVSWEDTLCKRALQESLFYTNQVAEHWGDSEAASALGITTYLSQPIYVGDTEVYGTLCGVSRTSVNVSTEARRLMSMLSRIISREVERNYLLDRLQKENISYSHQAMTDPLTGIPNRRSFHSELSKALANRRKSDSGLFVAFIDLDGFKEINDRYGHDAGDRLLIEITQKMASGMRETDFLARYGGDEFILFGRTEMAHHSESRETIQARLESLTSGTFELENDRLYYQGASVGVVIYEAGESADALITRADNEMYSIKKSRRANR